MTPPAAALPEDPEDLRQYCRQLLGELSEQKQLVAKLSHELALFRRYLYGRRSEKLVLDPAQLLLEFTGWLKAMSESALAGDPAPPPPTVPGPIRPRSGHGRTPLPAFLPRRRVEHALPAEQCTCPKCGAGLVKIGEETSEQRGTLSGCVKE